MDQIPGPSSKNSKRASSPNGRTMDVKKIRVDLPSTSTGGEANKTSKTCNVYDMSSLKDSVNNLKMPGGGLKQNIHGPEFQLGMLMLVLWRAYIHKYEQFRLATELEEAEKFDDIVFQWRGNDADKWTLRLIQAKHKEGETIPKIDRANLLSENGNDFELQKYFQSFTKIKRRCVQESFYCPFSKAEIKDVLLVTNTDLKDEELKNSFDVDYEDIDIRNDKLLGVDSHPDTVTYKISQKESDPLRQDLKQILERSSDFYKLVHTIAKSIMKKEPLNKTITVIKEFIHPLRRDVFSCEKQSGKGILTFSQAFFDTTNFHPELDKFRDALLEEIAFSRSCWKFEVRNTFGGSSTSLSDELLQKLTKKMGQKIKDNSELELQDCLGAKQIVLEQVINRETRQFYSKFLENKGNKLVKLRDFLRKETGMAYSKLASVQIKISSELSEFSMSADKDVLNKIADAFASQLQTQGGNTASLEERLSADLIAYENVLAKKVLNVDKGELLDSFKSGNIENDPKFDIKEFRRILMKKIVSSDRKKEAESFLKETKITVSEELANDMQFDGNLAITNPVEFARQFHKILEPLVSQLPHSDSPLDVIIEETKCSIIFSQNICVLGKSSVFVEKFQKIRLSTAFFKSAKLLGNLGEFKEKLIELFGQDKFNMIFKFAFDIRIKAFQCEREECAFQTLPQPFDESEFKDFLGKFRLVVNYPNRKHLMRAIQREIQTKKFNLNSRVLKALLHEKLGKWMSKRVGTFYTHKKAQNLFDDIDREALNWCMDGVSKSFFSSTPTISYQSCANELEHFLSSSPHKILNIIVKEGLILGRTRIVDSFHKLKQNKAEYFHKYVPKFGYLFFESNKLRDSGFNDDVLKCLYDRDLWNLIVIEIDNISEVRAELEDLLTAGRQALACKIVTISNESIEFPELKDLMQIEISTEMSQLTEESQKTILLKKVLFQDESVELGQLLDWGFRNLVDGSVLAKLIDGQKIRIGTELQFSYGYNSSFYVQRRLVEKLADNTKLKATEDELVEMCSPDILDAEKCVFIANEEGMGKTTFFSSLSDKLKQKYPQYWVIRIDLNFYTSYFKTEQDNRKSRKKKATLCLDDDGSSAIEYMLELLQSRERSELNTKFEITLFQSCMRQSMRLKCILLFDSFDEICPTYADIVRDLLSGLEQTQVHRMFITGRSWAIKDWLGDFEEAPIKKLRRFTYPEQIEFLTNFWQERLIVVDEGEMVVIPEVWLNKLDHFAESVINKYSSTTYNSFTGVPLHLHLLAEYFEEYDTDSEEENHGEAMWQGCVEFMRSENDHPILPEVLDVFDLFKGFIRKKFKIFQVEKMRLIESNVFVRLETEDWFESFAVVHRLLALFVITPPERELDILSIMGEQENVSTEIQRCLELVRVFRTRHGIIDQIVDGKPHFIQRTFAEYFFVDCIGSVLLKPPSIQHPALYRALLKSIFVEYDFYFIWNLFERWLERNAHSIPKATKRDFGKYIVSQWNQNENEKEKERSKFLVAPIENNLVNTVKLICDSIKEFDSDSLLNIVNKEEVLRCTIAPGSNDLKHGPDLRDELYEYGCINAREMEMIEMHMSVDSDNDDDSDADDGDDCDADEDDDGDDGDDSDADEDDDGDLKPCRNKRPVSIYLKKITNANSEEPNSLQIDESNEA